MGHVAAPTAVRFEHRTDQGPVLGIGTATPRLSWIVPAADAGFVQEAYEVELTCVGKAPEVVRVTSGEQVLVPLARRPVDVAGVGAGTGAGAWGRDAVGLERSGDGGGRAAQDR